MNWKTKQKKIYAAREKVTRAQRACEIAFAEIELAKEVHQTEQTAFLNALTELQRVSAAMERAS
jgi:7,8-dihydro-6-hydroxymethylpterin-pyrophosphokinase